MHGVMTDLAALRPLLDDATARLLASVDGLDDDGFAGPSALPGWSRAHVVAHLALNAEGLAAALTGVARDAEVPMYASAQARDGDIAELAAHPPGELRTRLGLAIRGFVGALGLVPPESWSTEISRTPDDPPTFLASDVLGMRLREVEIHHVDLDRGYGRGAWSPEFGAHLVGAMAGRVVRRDPATAPGGFTVRATDLGREWDFGAGPVVSGSVADLGWWLTGRGGADRLEVSEGPMPTIRKW